MAGSSLAAPGTSFRALPHPDEGKPGIVGNTGAARVMLAGGDLLSKVTAIGLTPVERIFRRNPVEGTLTASPSKPFRFELGSFTVPSQESFVVLDWRFAIYVPSGSVAGNSRELEDRQLSTNVGYDVRFTANRPANQIFELEPSNPATLSQGTFRSSPLSPGFQPTLDEFARIRANEFSASVGSGTSTLPQRRRRDSQLYMPFTYVVAANQRINLDVIVFRPINMPVSFFESEITGFFIGSNNMERFLREVAISTEAPQ